MQSDWDGLFVDVKRGTEILAIRLHGFGHVCLDADTLKRASAMLQACSDTQVSIDEKRGWAHEVKVMLKKFDKESPWSFEYIRNYARVAAIPNLSLPVRR